MSTSPAPAPTPGSRRPADDQARLDAVLTEVYETRIRFNAVLGHRVISLAPNATRIRFDMRPELVGHFLYGRLHGGVISATLDVVGSLALMVAIAEKHADESSDQVLHRFSRLGTIDLRVDYLRQGVGAFFEATAEVTRLGGRVGSTQMRLVNDAGILVATGAAAYVVA